jgi:hypothetical protein
VKVEGVEKERLKPGSIMHVETYHCPEREEQLFGHGRDWIVPCQLQERLSIVTESRTYIP